METITLGRTSIRVSQLGYGTAGLMRCRTERARMNMLAAAFDSGITHYDTAPIYGLGECERLLGRFGRGKRRAITVTTKFGLRLNRAAASLSNVQSFARRLLSASPTIAAAVRARAKVLYKPPAFSAEQAQTSLEASLRTMRTDYVDFFLLHECSVETRVTEDLLICLERLRRDGKVRAFGIATNFQHGRAFQALYPALCDVMQFESDALNPNVLRLRLGNTLPALITHSVFTSALPGLRAALMADPVLTRHWSETLAVDVTEPATLARLLLTLAIADNPTGVVLVHSNSIEHVVSNAAAAREVPADSTSVRLRQLLTDTFTPLSVETTITASTPL